MTPRARPSLVTLVRRSLRGECALPRGSALVVAVSGGPDSMALLSVLGRLGPELGLDLSAHGVDHGLRPEASRELDLAESFAASTGIPFERSVVNVPRGGNLQARARELRWRAIVASARARGAAIATAHHADDRAETLLMRLLRGAGARGLGVLPPRGPAPEPPRAELEPEATGCPTVVRPLLRARRAEVLEHLERHGVPSARDPSNDDPRYLRTHVRRDVLPLLARLDPNVVRHLASLADELAGQGPPQGWAAKLPRATQEALAHLAESGSPSARVWLPGGLVVAVDPRPRKRSPRSPR